MNGDEIMLFNRRETRRYQRYQTVLREFSFANGRFFLFCGNLFCDWEKLVSLAGN